MVAYLVVAEGGEYSDAYHTNINIFITEEEAREYIRQIREKYKPFEAIEDRFHELTSLSSLAEKYVVVPAPGTPNKRDLIYKSRQEAYEKALPEWLLLLNHFLDKFNLSPENRALVYKWSAEYKGLNIQVQSGSDLLVEEVDVPEGSRLWHLLQKSIDVF